MMIPPVRTKLAIPCDRADHHEYHGRSIDAIKTLINVERMYMIMNNPRYEDMIIKAGPIAAQTSQKE